MTPMDDYFRSGVVKRLRVSDEIEVRWRAFQRLPHALQAEEIDEILRKAKEGELSDAEFYIVQAWEAKRNPVFN